MDRQAGRYACTDLLNGREEEAPEDEVLEVVLAVVQRMVEVELGLLKSMKQKGKQQNKRGEDKSGPTPKLQHRRFSP